MTRTRPAANPDQDALFGGIPTPAAPVADAPVRGRSRARRPMRPDRVVPLLEEVQDTHYGLLDDTDRVMVFEDYNRVRAALDEDLILHLLAEGYVERCPPRDMVSCLHGVIRKPVLPLRLTKTGDTLMHRWSSYTSLP